MMPRMMKNTPRASKKMLIRLNSPRNTKYPRTNPIAMITAPQKMLFMTCARFEELQCSKFGHPWGSLDSSSHLSEYYAPVTSSGAPMRFIKQLLATVQETRIEVTPHDGQGAWYTHPIWTAIGIIVLVLLIVLISVLGRRDRTSVK